MNAVKHIPILLLVGALVGASRPSPQPLAFAASTPCDGIPRMMLAIPPQSACEFITWNLFLHRDPSNQAPITFRLRYTYGMSKPGTQGFLNGGTTVVKEGKWTILKGAGMQETYRLNPDTPETAISFTKLNDHLLHLLDSQQHLMIGHAGWSYTMNRNQ